MSGPLVRILVQLVVSGVGIVARGVAGAYAKGQARNVGKAGVSAARARSAMEPRQAREILNFEPKQELTVQDVLNNFNKYFAANDPAVGGSLYLQSKIHNAKETLFMEMDVDPDEFAEEVAGTAEYQAKQEAEAEAAAAAEAGEDADSDAAADGDDSAASQRQRDREE